MKTITDGILRKIEPSDKPLFIRDSALKGFRVKVNKSGSIKFIAETWHQGRSYRQTLGEFPLLKSKQTRKEAISFLNTVKSGNYKKFDKSNNLQGLFECYIAGNRLKTNTLKNYREVICFYLADWLNKPVSSITKDMVERRFYQIRDKGIKGGKPTYSQATKTMRILSALMNYAIADDLIESNPVDVLKLKRIDRSIKKREHYLPSDKVRELLDKTAQDSHPVTLAVHLMIRAGLRKNEALRLKWSDLRDIEGIPCLLIGDTKNHRPHQVPVTEQIQAILDKAQNESPYIFQSTQKKDHHVNDVRPTLKRLTKLMSNQSY